MSGSRRDCGSTFISISLSKMLSTCIYIEIIAAYMYMHSSVHEVWRGRRWGLWGEESGHPGPAQRDTFPVARVRHQKQSLKRVKVGQRGLGKVPHSSRRLGVSCHENPVTTGVVDSEVRFV